MGSLGLGCMTEKYVNYDGTSPLAPRSESQMFSGAMWQLKERVKKIMLVTEMLIWKTQLFYNILTRHSFLKLQE